MIFQEVNYKALNARQKEGFNFHQVAAKLALFGYNSIKLTDDWQGADFIAQHKDGNSFLKVQLKSRLRFDKKYFGKEIQIGLRQHSTNEIWVYDHDAVYEELCSYRDSAASKSLREYTAYDWPQVPNWARAILRPYKL